MVGDIKRTYAVKTYFVNKDLWELRGKYFSGLFPQTLQAERHNGSRWLKHVTLHPSAQKHVPDTGRL